MLEWLEMAIESQASPEIRIRLHHLVTVAVEQPAPHTMLDFHPLQKLQESQNVPLAAHEFDCFGPVSVEICKPSSVSDWSPDCAIATQLSDSVAPEWRRTH